MKSPKGTKDRVRKAAFSQKSWAKSPRSQVPGYAVTFIVGQPDTAGDKAWWGTGGAMENTVGLDTGHQAQKWMLNHHSQV